MVKAFTPEQEKLLRAILPGVRSGQIGTLWTVIDIDGDTSIIDNAHHQDTNFYQLGWRKATEADFDHFVAMKIFTRKEGSNYTLNKYELEQAFNRDFHREESPPPTYNIHIRDINGNYVNIGGNQSIQTLLASAEAPSVFVNIPSEVFKALLEEAERSQRNIEQVIIDRLK